MFGQTRIYCDSVEGLGDFVELEVIKQSAPAYKNCLLLAPDKLSLLARELFKVSIVLSLKC